MNKQRILTPILLAGFFALGATACERDSGTGTPPAQRAPDAGTTAPERSPGSPSTSPSQPGTSPSQPGGSSGSGGPSGTQQ